MTGTGKSALRAAVYLARHHTEEGLSLAIDIATAEEIPKKFLEALLVELRNENIVVSGRAQRRLSLPPERIGVSDIIRAIAGAASKCAAP